MRTFWEMRMMSRAGIIAPTNALRIVPASPTTPFIVIPMMIAATAPKQAPEDIPVL